MAKATFTTKEVILNNHEIFMIETHGGLCLASAKSIFTNSKIDFDDIERLNGIFKNHKWGSDADRRYRTKSINQAVNSFSKNPLKYISL